ncbi:hypothetical protein EC2731150_4863 [Escherichia coli 2731150]|nr:hypothetical protein EC2731150_4863 [Escherichia coli 2731150]KDW64725.1 hypothetical protein AC40_4014 [Escherichia coli 2-005-03_S3_C3]
MWFCAVAGDENRRAVKKLARPAAPNLHNKKGSEQCVKAC